MIFSIRRVMGRDNTMSYFPFIFPKPFNEVIRFSLARFCYVRLTEVRGGYSFNDSSSRRIQCHRLKNPTIVVKLP